MALHLKESLIEEIALEGLDGITINTLWTRLLDRKDFTQSIDDAFKSYIWKCILGLEGFEFYRLSQPRADLIAYNRFHYIDPETKHFLETDHVPDDIYPLDMVEDEGVLGSCIEYKTRENVSEKIRGNKPALEEVIEEYGSTLVIVASQETRLRALMGADNDPNFQFDDFSFCILERIGRARYNGESSYGRLSLQIFRESPKTLYYMLKKLRRLNVMRKQRLLVVKKPTNVKVTCFLYHLNRFYQEIGNRLQLELVNLVTYLSEKPECMEEVVKVKADLKLFDMFKKLTQLASPSGDRYFEFIDVPWREKHPDAKPRDYLMKNHLTEKKIRHVRLLKTLKQVYKSFKEAANRESDDEEEEEDAGFSDAVLNLKYTRVYDQPNLYQVMQILTRAGSRGLSQVELKTILQSTRLAVRRLVKFLERTKYITTVMEDRGRQKTIMYVSVDSVQENAAHRNVKEEMKKLQNVIMEPIPVIEQAGPSSLSGTGKSKKQVPVVRFKEEVPTEEKVTEIREELDRLDDNVPFSPQKLSVKKEILMELQLESGVSVVVEELIPEQIINKRTGKAIIGMNRFGSMLTESHVRRGNWVLEVIAAIKVVEHFRLLKLLRNREKELNFTYNMDQKSLKRLLAALYEEKKLRTYKAVITIGGRTKEFLYLCDVHVTAEDKVLLRMMDEAKLRYFSVSREELRNRNMLKQAQVKTNKEKKDVESIGIPVSAVETIKNHQEYRRKLSEQLPAMKYDRQAGKQYGLLAKMLRIQQAHQYLFHLCYDTHGMKSRTVQSHLTSSDVASKYESDTSDTAIHWKGEDTLDVVETPTEFLENEPPIYTNEMTWRRYLPPIPVHSGYPKGWVLVSDVLMNMPVCLFCSVVNVCYNIDGLSETLKHPRKRFYPVINLPFALTQQLLHSKKYVQSFSTLCAYMAEMGLLSYGREVLKDKDQTFVYIHKNASLLDTKESLTGYNKTRAPEGNPFKLKNFHFEQLADLQHYWEFLQITAVNSNLGYKSMVHPDLEDDTTFEVKSLKEASAAYLPETVVDNGMLPGDQRGGAGLDSSLFSHTIKNWSNSVCTLDRQYRKFALSKGLKGGLDIDSKREVVDMFNKNRLIGKDRLLLSENLDQPIVLKKVTRENIKGNKGGKGIQRSIPSLVTKTTQTHTFINSNEGKVMKKRCIKHQAKNIQRKKPNEKGDEKDKHIYRERWKQRVIWSTKEDSVILMCRLATLIMDNKKKISLISYLSIRDLLHEKCGEVSLDKTSQAVQRRIKFVLKNPKTETNLLLYYREAMQDEFVLTSYVSKEFILTDEDLVPNFRSLVDYLLDKFKSLDLQKSFLPDSVDDLRRNYTVQYIGKLSPHRLYTDVKNKSDICQDVLRNILHSAVLLQDKQGRTHEMFKLLTQYPDILLSRVVKELRNDGLFVINKKHYERESISQLQTGMGLRNFKVSQRYLYQYKHRYLSYMFEESAALLTTLCNKHLDGEDEMHTMSYRPRSDECAAIFPLILNRWLDFKINMPQEMVIVDLEGFYKFPWGRGKNYSSQTKGDRMQLPLSSKEMQSEPQSGTITGCHSEEVTATQSWDVTDASSIRDELEADAKKGGTSLEHQNKKYDNETKCNSKEKMGAESEQGNNVPEKVVTKKSESEYKPGKLADLFANIDSQDTNRIKKNKDKEPILQQGKTIEKTEEDKSGECTHVSTKHSKVIIPKMDLVELNPDQNVGSYSGIASRTLLSLRRAEDCSFEDLRIFNAQDNFVVNSCEIGIKIRDPSDEGKGGNAAVVIVPADKGENAEDRNPPMAKEMLGDEKVPSDDILPTEASGDAVLSAEERRLRTARLLLDKDKVKNIYRELQTLLPFQLDMDEVWARMKGQGVSEEDLGVYQNVFQIINSNGELGIRLYDLMKQFKKGYPWRETVDILIHQCAVLKVGVTCTRYVSLNNARPWVIHAYRNIKGRGLHLDEDSSNSLPIEKVEEGMNMAPHNTDFIIEQAESRRTALDVAVEDRISIVPGSDEHAKEHGTGESSPRNKKIWSDLEEELRNDGVNIANKRTIPGELNSETDTVTKRRKIDSETYSGVDLVSTERIVVGNEGKNYKDAETTKESITNSEIRSDKTAEEQAEKQKGQLNIIEDVDLEVQCMTECNTDVKKIPSKTEGNVAVEDATNTSNNDSGTTVVDTASANQSVTNVDDNGMQMRRLRKRKFPEELPGYSKDRNTAVSTYDKVRLVIQPWRKPEGGINKAILKMMLESIMLYLMMNPACPEEALIQRYAPYIQPMMLRNIIDILEDIGCLTKQYLRRKKTTLFSKPTLPELGIDDDENNIILIIPTEDCVLKLGLFGQEIYPNAKWPENTYPIRKDR